MLAASASILVFFSYLLTSSRTPTPIRPSPPRPAASKAVATAIPAAPAGLVEQLNLFLQYPIITDLDRLSHFDEIAAVDLSGEKENELAKEEEVPPDLLQNPSFFAHY